MITRRGLFGLAAVLPAVAVIRPPKVYARSGLTALPMPDEIKRFEVLGQRQFIAHRIPDFPHIIYWRHDGKGKWESFFSLYKAQQV